MENMNIFAAFKARRADREAARLIYDALLAQARQPVFYTGLGVPDTTDGRFDMIALHAFIVMRGGAGMNTRLSQYLFDTIFRDFDRACREMGIGDLSVPRHMKRMMKAFKGRCYAYNGAANGGLDDPELMGAVLERNLYRKTDEVDPALLNAVAAYVNNSLMAMARLPEAAFRAGRLAFAPIEVPHGNRQQAA